MANWLTRLFNRKSHKEEREFNNPFATLLERQFNQMFGLTSNPELLSSNKSWVYACVSAIAAEVANINLRLMRRIDGEEVEVEDDEILQLINRVNPRMTRYELFEITQSHLELEGNAYWLLTRDNNNKIVQIWPLRPDRVIIRNSKENPLVIDSYIYKPRSGGKVQIPEHDIIHFQQFNAEGDYPFPTKGVGTLEAAALAVDTNTFAQEWNKNFFLNSARPDMLLKTEGVLSKEEFEQLKRKFNSAFQGTQKAHKFMLLQGGLDIEKLSESAKDMDFVNQVTATRDEILAVFRVPKTVLGITDDVNRANAEATNFVFAQRTIEPKMTKLVDTLNEFLLPMFDDSDDLFLAFDSPVPENRDRIVEEYTKGIDKWLTRNDIRRAEGLRETEEGDSIFAPFTVQAIDNISPEEPQERSQEEASHKEEKPEKTGDVVVDATREAVSTLFDKVKAPEIDPPDEDEEDEEEQKAPALTFNQIQTYGVGWVKSIETNEQEFLKLLVDYFTKQQKDVDETIREELKGLKAKEFSLKQVDNLLPDEEEQVEAVIELMTPLYEEFVKQSGQDAIALTGLDEVFNVDDPDVQDFLEERAEFFGASINDTTFKRLTEELEEGLEAGEDIEQLSARVESVYENRVPERIARTEVSAAGNFGSLQGFKQVGIERKQWVNFDPPDPLVETCAPDPDTIGINEEFSNGLLTPPAHPNCVCTIIPIF